MSRTITIDMRGETDEVVDALLVSIRDLAARAEIAYPDDPKIDLFVSSTDGSQSDLVQIPARILEMITTLLDVDSL